MPLDEVKAFLRLADPAEQRAAVARRRARIEPDLEQARAALALLDDVLSATEHAARHEVTVRRFSASRYVGLRHTVPFARFPDLVPRAYQDLVGYLASVGRGPAGPNFAIYRAK